MPECLEMKKIVCISNPLLQDTILIRECEIKLEEMHSYISEPDALELQLYKANKGYTNKQVGVPLKIQLGQNIAYITAYITCDKTIIGRLAMDELSCRL